jgi:hypothetical protein
VDEKDTSRDALRLSLDDESGMTRRDLMRRGAVVGGTLLWVAPAIQSFGAKAYAQVQGPSPGNCAACYCYTLDGNGNVSSDECSDDGVIAPGSPQRFSADACETFCRRVAGYENSQYCSGTKPACSCTQNEGGQVIGVECNP